MDKLYIINFALKNLFSHRLRTYLTLVGIMIGISAIVFLVSFAFGIEKLVTSEITGGDAFKLIDVGTGNSQVVRLDSEAITNLRELQGAEGCETAINIAAESRNGENTMDVAFFAASQKYAAWSGSKPRVGRAYKDDSEDEIMVNTAYLEFMKIANPSEAIGRKIAFDLIIPKELLEGEEGLPLENRQYEIIGVVENQNSPSVFSSQKALLPYVKNFSQAKIEVSNRENVFELRKQIESMGFKTQYVGDTVSQIEQIFNVFKIILGSFGLIALIVASLGMFNTLTISLLERMKEVALLKILGTQKSDIAKLFMVEALIFGAIGGILGILFGVLAGKIFNYFLNIYAVQSGGDAVTMFYYPAWFIVSILSFALLVGALTGIYPAKRAARVNSLDVIRYE